jgi:hypothetical protein
LLELLEAERDIDPPSSAVRERTYARLAPLIQAAAAAVPGVDPQQDVEQKLPESPRQDSVDEASNAK